MCHYDGQWGMIWSWKLFERYFGLGGGPGGDPQAEKPRRGIPLTSRRQTGAMLRMSVKVPRLGSAPMRTACVRGIPGVRNARAIGEVTHHVLKKRTEMEKKAKIA